MGSHSFGQFRVFQLKCRIVGTSGKRVHKGQTFQLFPVNVVETVYRKQEQGEEQYGQSNDDK